MQEFMLKFENLSKLSSHHSYLSDLLGQQQFFFVGGLIRDLLLDRTTNMNDVDITMSGEPGTIKSLIHEAGRSGDKNFSFFDTEKYGTMTIIPKSPLLERGEGGDHGYGNGSSQTLLAKEGEGPKGEVKYEITPFRTETTYSDGRHPDEVVRSNSLLEDSQRRDFTINCMYYSQVGAEMPKGQKAGSDKAITNEEMIKALDKQGRFFDESSQTLIVQDHTLIQKLLDGNLEETISQHIPTLSPSIATVSQCIFDPHQGIQDLLAKKIRCVGNPDQRLQEDSLRLIRALRFAIALECDFNKETRTSLQKNAYLVRQVAKERIKQELDKVFQGNNPFGFVALLDELNMLKRIFPKLYDNKGVVQPVRYHPFDVYTHSMMVLYHAQRLSDDYILRYAALYHDVGKVEQYSSYAMDLGQDGIREMFSSWLNHSICGAEFAHNDFGALAFSHKERDQIERYVRQHMKPGEILNGDEKSQRKKIRSMIAEVGPDIVKKLCLLTVADRLGQYNPLQAPEIESVYGLMALVDTLMAEEGRFTMKQLVVDGDFLMKEFKLTPGPDLGVLLKEIFERVCDNIAHRNDRTVIVEWVKQGRGE